MSFRSVLLIGGLAVAAIPCAVARAQSMKAPKTVTAGSAFTIQTSGSGNATLFIVGPAQVLKRSVQLGQSASFTAGTLHNAGHYLVILAAGSSKQSASLNVLPDAKAAKISFLAGPSRLPVNRHDGITGTAYIFDKFGNLVTEPTPVSFTLTSHSGNRQTHSAVTHFGAAWTQMSSTAHQGLDHFVARAGEASVPRLVRQVAGNPCQLTLTAKQSGPNVELKTKPVRDCSGNPVPDGTIVTFTENYRGLQSTADVPLKHGIAKVDFPAHPGAELSVASGVVLGNQIRWEQ